MKPCIVVGLFAGMALAAGGGGIRPRGSSADYPTHETAGGVTIGAAVIPSGQVRKVFATDLNSGGYLVIEVAVYPDAGREIDLSAGDFMLRAGSDSENMRAVNGSAIASALQRKNAPRPAKGSDVSVYPTATIGYESGGYDPATGSRRGGVYTGSVSVWEWGSRSRRARPQRIGTAPLCSRNSRINRCRKEKPARR